MVWGGLSLLVSVTFLCQPTVWVSLEARAATLDHRERQKHQKPTHVYSSTEDSSCPLSSVSNGCCQQRQGHSTAGSRPGHFTSEYFMAAFCRIREFSGLSHQKVTIVVFNTDLKLHWVQMGDARIRPLAGLSRDVNKMMLLFFLIYQFLFWHFNNLHDPSTFFFHSLSLSVPFFPFFLSPSLHWQPHTTLLFFLIINEAVHCNECEQSRSSLGIIIMWSWRSVHFHFLTLFSLSLLTPSCSLSFSPSLSSSLLLCAVNQNAKIITN